MPKHYKEMIDEIINKMDESNQMGYVVKFSKSKGGKISTAWYKSEADAKKALEMLKKDGLNGIITRGRMDEDAPANNTSGTDMNPTGVKMSPKTLRRKKEQGDEQDDISNKISKMVKANEDNNNVILKQVNESLAKVEDKSDERLGLKQDVEIVEVKEDYKTFRDKYNA
tara:strand:+ start:340 stop:846 length:507 start_codon:yes stop_codon:yes gene_type:complete